MTGEQANRGGRPKKLADNKWVNELILGLSQLGYSDVWIGGVLRVSKAWVWRRRQQLMAQKGCEAAQNPEFAIVGPNPTEGPETTKRPPNQAISSTCGPTGSELVEGNKEVLTE